MTEDERLRAVGASRTAVAVRGIPPRCDLCGRLAAWWYGVLNLYLCPCCASDES